MVEVGGLAVVEGLAVVQAEGLAVAQADSLAEGLIERADRTVVCGWGEGHNDYSAYHDHEWGVPITSDAGLYERMCLEGFQSGLSWLTILRKRENFRAAFENFNIEAVAAFGQTDVERLLGDAGIIRHRGKIEATVNNARAALGLIATHGGLAPFFWSFAPEPGARPDVVNYEVLKTQTQTPESKAMSKALKLAGWRFVGPTTCYALMQATGIVNDHLDGCYRRCEVERLRVTTTTPSSVAR